MLVLLRRLLKGSVATGNIVGLVRAFRSAVDDAPAGLELLTPRERDVLRLLAVGLSNRAIAERLVTSEATVKSHVHRLIGKLGVASRAQVIVRSRELGTLQASLGQAVKAERETADGLLESAVLKAEQLDAAYPMVWAAINLALMPRTEVIWGVLARSWPRASAWLDGMGITTTWHKPSKAWRRLLR